MGGGEPAREDRIALWVEYDGTEYSGFQYQRNAPSIQAELERALERLTGTPTRVKGAGRTDAGAHALGQVVAFSTPVSHPPDVFLRALNGTLPPQVKVRAARRVDPEFDPRRDALARRYRYAILNRDTPSPLMARYTHRVPHRLSVDRMAAAAERLPGERDFASFGGPLPSGATTVRRLGRCAVWRRGQLLLVEMEANAFLPGQVRRTVGALLEVARGRAQPERLTALLEEPQPGVAGPAAPPEGLCLVQVEYEGIPPPPPVPWPPGLQE